MPSVYYCPRIGREVTLTNDGTVMCGRKLLGSSGFCRNLSEELDTCWAYNFHKSGGRMPETPYSPEIFSALEKMPEPSDEELLKTIPAFLLSKLVKA